MISMTSAVVAMCLGVGAVAGAGARQEHLRGLDGAVIVGGCRKFELESPQGKRVIICDDVLVKNEVEGATPDFVGEPSGPTARLRVDLHEPLAGRWLVRVRAARARTEVAATGQFDKGIACSDVVTVKGRAGRVYTWELLFRVPVADSCAVRLSRVDSSCGVTTRRSALRSAGH